MATDLDNYLLSNENKERCIKELEETSFLFQFANKKSRETTAQSSRSAAVLIPLISRLYIFFKKYVKSKIIFFTFWQTIFSNFGVKSFNQHSEVMSIKKS